MKNLKNILTASIIIIFINCNTTVDKKSNSEIYNVLNSLTENKSYFKLRKYFEANKDSLSKTDKLYFQSIIYKVFNKPKLSNNTIEKLLKYKTQLNDTLLNKIYNSKLSNNINLFEYKIAAETSKYIQQNFIHLTDSSDVEMLKNELNIWNALSNTPKQEVIKSKDENIIMKKDKVGLFNIDISTNNTKLNFIFDTGANFSVIKKSMVEKLNFQYIKANFYATAATGKKVNCDIAIAKKIVIGNITLKNVVFLVLEDKDFSFPQINYFPNGAIGFPVIEALDEIRINKKNEIFVPQKPIAYTSNNFALNELMPIIACEYKGDLLRFNFDTGASRTSLYPLFYEEYNSYIKQNYTQTEFTTASAGGKKTFKGYKIDSLHLKVANSSATIKNIILHIDNIGGKKSNFHGNFGQDYIKQFDQMILSFKHASVIFK